MYNFTVNILRCCLIILFLTISACSSVQNNQASSLIETKIQQRRVILVGETHTNYGHHLNQLEIIKKARQKWGGALSIGLEMVQTPFQESLDDYIAGNITEVEMLHGVEWYARWRYDFRLYRPIFDFAKQHKIPLIALNIPQELSRKISQVGLNGLSNIERKQLPSVIDKSNIGYTARLKKVFALHAHGKTFNQASFNKFVDVQLAWDEGMAFAASNYLLEFPKKRMVILAGSGHLINREGIPSRVDRLLKLTPDQRSLVILSHDDKAYNVKEADFSLPTKDIKLPAAGLMGIGMAQTKQGVKISNIIQLGAAQRAGLQKEDVLLKLNKTAVKSMSDVHLWRLDKKPNDTVDVLIRRGTQWLKKRLILGSPIKK